jgi:hypothetical protein
MSKARRQLLVHNTTGFHNTATGSNALYTNTSGFYNTATGSNALYVSTTGVFNTASGYDALFSTTTGQSNTDFPFVIAHFVVAWRVLIKCECLASISVSGE